MGLVTYYGVRAPFEDNIIKDRPTMFGRRRGAEGRVWSTWLKLKVPDFSGLVSVVSFPTICPTRLSLHLCTRVSESLSWVKTFDILWPKRTISVARHDITKQVCFLILPIFLICGQLVTLEFEDGQLLRRLILDTCCHSQTCGVKRWEGRLSWQIYDLAGFWCNIHIHVWRLMYGD